MPRRLNDNSYVYGQIAYLTNRVIEEVHEKEKIISEMQHEAEGLSEYNLLLTIPGFGVRTVTSLIGELGDIFVVSIVAMLLMPISGLILDIIMNQVTLLPLIILVNVVMRLHVKFFLNPSKTLPWQVIFILIILMISIRKGKDNLLSQELRKLPLPRYTVFSERFIIL